MDEVSKTIETYDKVAPDYCRKTRQPKFLEWEEDFIRKLLGHIAQESPLILDVGCGDGRHVLSIEKNGGRAIGIDLSNSMVKEAKALYPEGDFRKMDMRILSFDDDSFNGIWASGCIYHVPKMAIGGIIEGFRRVLKPEGVAAINFKLGSGEQMEADPKSYSGAPRYFAYYSEEEMEELFSGFGFKVLESCAYPEDIFGDKIQQMWFRLIRK
jgi:ubiquinone/menaquinone biosynthesis C-methylase UbiE